MVIMFLNFLYLMKFCFLKMTKGGKNQILDSYN